MRQVIVTSKFAYSTLNIKQYIEQYSTNSAEKFSEKLKEKIQTINRYPEAFPPAPQLPTKRNWYRYALFFKSYKIIYKVTAAKIVFLDIVHTKQNPERIKDLRTNDYS